MSNNQELFSHFSYILHVCGDLLQLSRRISHEISNSWNLNGFQQKNQDFRNQELVQGEMFWWKRLDRLQVMYGYNLTFYCYMLNREMINYSGVKVFRNIDQNLHVKNVTQTSLIKVLLLKGVWTSRLKIQNVIYWSYYFGNLNFIKVK